MSRFRRYEIVEHKLPITTYNLMKEETTSIFNPFPFFPCPIFEHQYQLDLVPPPPPVFFDDDEHFETITDLIPFTRHLVTRTSSSTLAELYYLQKLNDRVSALEIGVDRMVKQEEKAKKKKKKLNKNKKNVLPVIEHKKYSYTAEIKDAEKERKYKWLVEKKGDDDKCYKWISEIKKGKDQKSQTYTVKVSSGRNGKPVVEEKKKKDKKKCDQKVIKARVVEIQDEEEDDEDVHGAAVVLRQVFAKRVEKRRGKRKELSYDDAAALIQKTFRAYLIRRSQALRALRDLAIAKSKLKEIRALFNNFTYRRRIARDAEEHQRFSEKIIVLLLTVDAIEGADLMVRAAKKSMVDELEAMLDVVDPQPAGKSLSMRRRTFDMPDAVMNKELAAGVAQVVRMLDEDVTGAETFEACL